MSQSLHQFTHKIDQQIKQYMVTVIKQAIPQIDAQITAKNNDQTTNEDIIPWSLIKQLHEIDIQIDQWIQQLNDTPATWQAFQQQYPRLIASVQQNTFVTKAVHYCQQHPIPITRLAPQQLTQILQAINDAS